MNGCSLIRAERRRQIDAEGFDAAHDAVHRDGSIARAGACYAGTAATQIREGVHKLPVCFIHKDWPWERQDWKPSDDPLDNLVKAGALLAAEIDRLLRAL